jgi:twitching motility protein PilT
MTDSPQATIAPELIELLNQGIQREASDLHLVVGYPPTFRIHGRLESAGGGILGSDDAVRVVSSIMPDQLRPRLGERHDFDFSIRVACQDGPHRFRVNVFCNQGQRGACLRFVPERIPSFDWMNFPKAVAERICQFPGGLVLITGVTGAGKTTTLAALVNLINHQGDRSIITIEEPIEYVFEPCDRSVISQREVGVDVPTFADGLKYGLRQDPDVILVGEIRDIDTARMALSAAETGHLVLSTVHTPDARGAITRLVDIFPRERHDDVRSQLSLSLRCVISQHLLPSAIPGEKRVLALEIMFANDSIRAAIRLNKIESIDSVIQTGRKHGMKTLDDDLQRLVQEGRISTDTARRFTKNPLAYGG